MSPSDDRNGDGEGADGNGGRLERTHAEPDRKADSAASATMSRPRYGARRSEAIDRRGSSVCSADIVVEQTNIAAGDLKRRGAVAEDPLEREDVAAVR